jgi:hypothetical protein
MVTAFEALNRLTKWRAFFAGWQLGTRPKGDAGVGCGAGSP